MLHGDYIQGVEKAPAKFRSVGSCLEVVGVYANLFVAKVKNAVNYCIVCKWLF